MLTGQSQTVKAALGKGPAQPLALPWPGGMGTEAAAAREGAWRHQGRLHVLLVEPYVRDANQMCWDEGTQVMRGRRILHTLNGRMQLLPCFAGCRLLPPQNKPVRMRGERRSGKKGTI